MQKSEKFIQAFSFHQSGQLTKARDLYLEIIKQEPRNHEVYDLLGVLYMQAQKFDIAQNYIKKAIEIHPEVYYLENLAQLYNKTNHYAESIEIYKILTKIDPNNYEYWFNIARAYKNCSMWDEAKLAYEKSIQINPKSYESYYNLAYLCFNENNPQGAVECYEMASKLNPEDWETKYFLSLAYMQIKNYKDGLKHFEQRLCRQSAIVSQEKTYPNLMKDKPLWTGAQDLSDKILYTYYEAGFGDLIMLYRFMPELTSCCKKVIFKPQSELVQLFRENSYGAQIMDMFVPENEFYFDYHLPFLSLPYVLGKSGEDMFIHHDDGYLKPNYKKVNDYKLKYFNNDKFKIGIKWQGNTFYEKERVLKVEDFYKLFEIPNIQFYSCQTYDGAEEFNKIKQNYDVIDLAPSFNDFSDTAAAIENLDLIICNDTSLVHLAGAMKKSCWVLLPHVYNWRWHDDLTKCDWYDSVKIFRQTSNGDWNGVFEQVYNQLIEMI